jgi:hypothetical protein
MSHSVQSPALPQHKQKKEEEEKTGTHKQKSFLGILLYCEYVAIATGGPM